MYDRILFKCFLGLILEFGLQESTKNVKTQRSASIRLGNVDARIDTKNRTKTRTIRPFACSSHLRFSCMKIPVLYDFCTISCSTVQIQGVNQPVLSIGILSEQENVRNENYRNLKEPTMMHRWCLLNPSCFKSRFFYPASLGLLVVIFQLFLVVPQHASAFLMAGPPRCCGTTKSTVYQNNNENDLVNDNDGSNNDNNVRSQIESLLSTLSSQNNNMDNDDNKEQEQTSQNSQVYIIGTGLSNCVADLPLGILSIIVRANVVLHDSLSLPPEEIRKVVSSSCIIQNVGKRGDDQTSYKQKDIDKLLLQYALGDDDCVKDGTSGINHDIVDDTSSSASRIVVRLKGGDPFLFGRSRTEIDALRQHDIPYEVIPNLSSCIAGPHYGGIPLTDPFLDAQSFAVFSGTNAQGIGEGSGGSRDWESMQVDTLVFLMIGRLDKLHTLCQRISSTNSVLSDEKVEQQTNKDAVGSQQRWNNETPCAIVQSAGRKNQRVWRGTLETLVEVIQQDLGPGVTTVSPAILVVGQTASLNLLYQP